MNTVLTKKERKAKIKQQKFDRQRSLRVVEYLEFSGILDGSPVEIEEGYIISDRNCCDIFASFVFKNVCEKPLKSLSIRLECYQNANIPYLNIDFTYCHDLLTFGSIAIRKEHFKLRDSNSRETVLKGESFGSAVYIPIPESYFKRMNVRILSAEFEDGEVKKIDMIAGGKATHITELDDLSKIVYTRLNVYQGTEEFYPTVVVPCESSTVWLCCCGNKNPVDAEICEHCRREKSIVIGQLSSDNIKETLSKMVADPTERVLHDKSEFFKNMTIGREKDEQKKIEEYEKVMKNIADMEKARERRQMMILPKILIYVGTLLFIVYLLQLLSRIL